MKIGQDLHRQPANSKKQQSSNKTNTTNTAHEADKECIQTKTSRTSKASQKVSGMLHVQEIKT